MTFKHITKLPRYNSDFSKNFLDTYEDFVSNQLIEESKIPSSKTIAPSSFRCRRKTWFRLKGTEPDEIKVPDKSLNFSADIGTACHRIIQSNLRSMLKDRWKDVSWYMYNNHINVKDYTCERDEDSLETQIVSDNPPIKFACDGVLFLNDDYYLLEIKTCTFSIWEDLVEPRNEHIDQVMLYASLLNIHNILFMYQDRQYGGIKCYDMFITDKQMDDVLSSIGSVLECVDNNIAPDPLPSGDKWCTPNMCQYFVKCQEYGRY